MGLIETAKRFFCLEKCVILASGDGFFQFLPKLVEEKVSSRTEKTGKNHGKNHPLEETANPGMHKLGSGSEWWGGLFSFQMAVSARKVIIPLFYHLAVLDYKPQAAGYCFITVF